MVFAMGPRDRGGTMAIRTYSDVLTPDELAFLTRIFDRICEERGIPREDARELAARLVTLYQGGTREEEALVAGLYPVDGGQSG